MKNVNSYYIWLTLFIVFITNAQVSIGTPNINNGVMMQLEATDKGLLLPRIALISRTSTSPLPSDIPNGTMVFNTVTTGVFPNTVTPGLHWWSSTEKQWTNVSTNLDNVTLKYTNSEFSTNYNTTNYQNVKLFGNKIINESSAVYNVNATDHSVTIGRSGLYSISTLLSFDRKDSDDEGRISLTAQVFVNNTAVGTEQIINPGFTTSINGNRGLFSHSFTEYLELNDGDVISIKIKRLNASYRTNSMGVAVVPFLKSGDSSISILRIR